MLAGGDSLSAQPGSTGGKVLFMELGSELRFHDATLQMPRERIMATERWGFDALFGAGEGVGPDALTPIAYAAAFTTRLKLGTRVAKVIGRSATTTAMTYQTIDQLAGGNRVMIGIGSSDRRYAEGWFDEPWGNPVARMRDYITVIRKVNSGEPVEHRGPTINLPTIGGSPEVMSTRLQVNPNIPILIAAHGPQMVQVAAELADGWFPPGFRPGMLEHFRPLLEAGFQRAGGGKGFGNFKIWGHVDMNVDDDVRRAMAPFKSYVCNYPEYQIKLMTDAGFGTEAENLRDALDARFGAGWSSKFHRPEEAPAFDDPLLDLVPDDYIDTGWLCGPVSRFPRLLEPWLDSGLTGLIVRYGAQVGHPAGESHYEHLDAFRAVAKALDKPGSD